MDDVVSTKVTAASFETAVHLGYKDGQCGDRKIFVYTTSRGTNSKRRPLQYTTLVVAEKVHGTRHASCERVSD